MNKFDNESNLPTKFYENPSHGFVGKEHVELFLQELLFEVTNGVSYNVTLDSVQFPTLEFRILFRD